MTEKDDRDLAREVDALAGAIEPQRDLWTGVAARIEAKRRRSLLVRGAATAGVVLLAAAGIALALRAPPREPVAHLPAPITSEPLPVAPPPPVELSLSPLAPEEASYRAALASLSETFAEREKQLPPEDARAFDASLRALDAAISVTRASLAEHPDDFDLRSELDDEYEQEIDTMNDVLEWTTRS